MYLKSTELTDFRNYRNQKIEYINGINLFIGNNAQGKTNIIESIYVSAFGKSYRAEKDVELLKFNSEFLRINTVIYDENQKENRKIEFFLDKNGNKKIELDEIKIRKLQDFVGNIPLVIFSPDSLDIVKGSPQKRRKFLDSICIQISKSYYINLYEYMKCLKLKNSELKKEKIDIQYIEVLHEKMSEYIFKICEFRKEVLSKLNNRAKEIQKNITSNKEEINLIYESDFLELDKENIKKRLKEYLKIDILRKQAVKGIQKDDFKIYINELEVSKFGSQGQQRTALLSLKLADYEVLKELKGQKPLLLLDDIMSELDNERIIFLLNYIKECQSVITTTDMSFTKDIENIKIYKVINGTLEII